MRPPVIERLARRRGNAIVELALVMPILALTAVFIADVGSATYRSMTLKGAARAGAEYLLRTGDTTGLQAVVAAAANRSIDSIEVRAAMRCNCGTEIATCGMPCTSGEPQTLWTVEASEPYTALVTPGWDGSDRRLLTAQITFRIR